MKFKKKKGVDVLLKICDDGDILRKTYRLFITQSYMHAFVQTHVNNTKLAASCFSRTLKQANKQANEV